MVVLTMNALLLSTTDTQVVKTTMSALLSLFDVVCIYYIWRIQKAPWVISFGATSREDVKLSEVVTTTHLELYRGYFCRLR